MKKQKIGSVIIVASARDTKVALLFDGTKGLGDTMVSLKKHLQSNNGDESIAKMIWICIAFVIGAFLLPLMANAACNPMLPWFENVIASWFNSNTAAAGSYVTP